MDIYVVRHGKTEWNILNKCQGSNDVPLSIEGINSAKELKKEIDKIEFDVCYCSNLSRAKETTNILLENKDISIVNSDSLNERYFGSLEGTVVNGEIVKEMWDYSLNSGNYGIETLKELLKRTKDFLEDIKKKNYRTVLIVSHGCTIKALHYNIIGYSDQTNFFGWFPENTKIYKYKI